MKVWVLTSGVYSDYKIEAIFSSEEKAYEYTARFPGSHISEYNDLEEMEVDPFEQEIKNGYSYFRVYMQENGDGEIHKEDKPGGISPGLTSLGRGKVCLHMCVF